MIEMKKLLLTLFVLLAPILYIRAQVQGEELELQIAYDDTPSISNPKPKTPVVIPTIIQNGHILLFITSCDNCTLRLINEDGEVEHSIVIPPGTNTLILPSYLSGEYRIEIIRGNFCFWGYVEFY
ncbi:MAG: hypothetical protein IJ647_00840 [Prevotella sp.]|nr:hypothetical protein [Prevotella sp.]